MRLSWIILNFSFQIFDCNLSALVINLIHSWDANATQLDSWVALTWQMWSGYKRHFFYFNHLCWVSCILRVYVQQWFKLIFTSYLIQHKYLGVKLLLWTGSSVLLQDRSGAGSGCYPWRSSGSHHNLSGFGHSAHGKEERNRAQSAFSRDPRLHVSHLLWQDWHSDHQPDVSLPGNCQSAFTFYTWHLCQARLSCHRGICPSIHLCVCPSHCAIV